MHELFSSFYILILCHFLWNFCLTVYKFLVSSKQHSWFGMENLIWWSLFLPNRWVRFGKDLELLDSPGILPMRISDQSAAIKLAICDDIGERSYDVVDVAAVLVQMLTKLPSVGTLQYFHHYFFYANKMLSWYNFNCHLASFRLHCTWLMFSDFIFSGLLTAADSKALHNRYRIDPRGFCGKTYVLSSMHCCSVLCLLK